jgi:hypothetical protein
VSSPLRKVIGYWQRFLRNKLTPLLVGVGGVTLLVRAGVSTGCLRLQLRVCWAELSARGYSL